MPDVAHLQIKVETVGVNKANRELNSLAKSGKNVESSNRSLMRSTSNLTEAFKGLKNAAGAYAAYNVVKSITRTGLEFDRMERSLFAATGSLEAAKTEMQFLRDETDRIGISLLATGKSYAQLSAAAKGSNITQSQVRDIFTSVSEAAVVLGLSADDTKGSMRALVQVMSKGKVQAEELRGQLGERFPGAFQAAARGMKLTTEQLSDMLERGDVLADDFLPKFAAEMKRTYQEAVPEAMASAQAAFARFSNAMANAENEVAQGGLLDALAGMATYTASWTNDAIQQVKSTAEWAAALSVGQISFYEWLTTGADEATEKLKALKSQMDNMDGVHIKMPKRPLSDDNKPEKKSRSEITAEKRALDRSKKAFARLQAELMTEEQAIQDSYDKRIKLVDDNTKEDYALRERLHKRVKTLYDEDMADLEAAQRTEFESLQSSLYTEEEAIKASYEERKKIIDSADFADPSARADATARIIEDRDKQLASLKEQKGSEFATVKAGLRDEEEVILDSYNKRREIIMKNTEATATEKAELVARLDAEFASDVIGDLGKPVSYNDKIAAVEEFYTRRHELIMSNTQLTAEAQAQLEIDLERQKVETIERLEKERMMNILKGSADTFSGLADMAKIFKGKQSKEYKVMFAASQAFEVAQAIMKTYDAATGAYTAMSSIPYVGPALGAAAAAAAVGAGMANVAMIKSQSYSGAYDLGGSIPSGSIGLVGEVGPELVSGPANVTSRKDTAALLSKEQAPPPPPPVNNIRIVNAFDPAVVGDYIGTDAGEQAVLNVVSRNSGTIKQMMG